MNIKTIVLSFLVILFPLTGVWAGTQPQNPIDLHNQKYSPYRNQYYFKLTPAFDSQFCHAMTLANLVGQVAKVAISPDDIVYQSSVADIYNENIGQLPYGTELSGFLKDDWEIVNQVGFCPQSDINSFLKTLSQDGNQDLTYEATQELYTYGISQTNWQVSDMAKLLNGICKNRIKINNYKLEKISIYNSQPYSEEGRQQLFQDKIDEALNQSRYVGFLYQGHYVTIVGRTADQRYLIQDSIPKTQWISHSNFEERQHDFEDHGGAIEFIDEHLQAWPKASLLYYLEEIGILREL